MAELHRDRTAQGFLAALQQGAFGRRKAGLPDQSRQAALLCRGQLGGDHLTGSAFTIADGYLYTMLRWANATGVKFGPKLAAHFERVGARAGVRRALQEEGLDG